MKNPTLGNELERSFVILPSDYASRMASVSSNPRMQELTKAIVHNLNSLITMNGGKPLNAFLLMTVLIDLLTKLIENKFPTSDIVAFSILIPDLFKILISDGNVRQKALNFWTGETDPILGPFRTKATANPSQYNDAMENAPSPANEQNKVPKVSDRD